MNTFGKNLIDNLLQQGKGAMLFLNKELNESLFGQTASALANANGGDIILGVDEKGRVTGLDGDAQEIGSKCMDIVRQDVSSNLPVNIQPIEYDDKQVLLVSVWAGTKKPYLYKDDFYVCVNGSVRRATVAQLNKLIMESAHAGLNWERVMIPLASLEDLDMEMVRGVMQSARNKINLGSEEMTEEEFLVKQGLMVQGMVTNACMMLFGKSPMKFIPQSAIRLFVYADNEAHQLVKTKIYTDNIFRNIDMIFDDFNDIYGNKMVINGLIRENREAFPKVALREAVLNAIIHRDMSSLESFLTISIFASKTEISNTGELMGGMTAASLKRQHNSVLRNPDMAYVCYLRQLMELAGSGTLRIVDNCKENGFGEPIWSNKSNVVKIVFPGLRPRLARYDVRKDVDGGKLVVSDVRDKELHDIVAYIRKHPGAKIAEIEKATSRSKSTLKRNLSFLKMTGKIVYEGNKRVGGYVVIDD